MGGVTYRIIIIHADTLIIVVPVVALLALIFVLSLLGVVVLVFTKRKQGTHHDNKILGLNP